METMERPSALRITGFLLGTGILVGIGVAELESALRLKDVQADRAVGFTFLLQATFLYTVFFALASLLLGGLVSLLRRDRAAPGGAFDGATHMALLLVLALLIVLGGHANYKYFPYAFATVSLIFDAGLLVAGALLFFLFRFVFRRISGGRFVRRTLATMVLLMLFPVALYVALPASLTSGTEFDFPRTRGGNADRPHVMLVIIDALRPDHLQCYGHPVPTSPFLDSLAEEGARFTNFFAQSTWTRTSTASLFTSLYPSSHGAQLISEALPETLYTLPEAFQDAGYATACISANSVVSPIFGFDQGIDYFHLPQGASVVPSRSIFIRRVVKLLRLVALERFLNEVCNQMVLADNDPLARTDAQSLNEDTFRYLEAYVDHGARAPLFLYVHYLDPHSPYGPPQPVGGTRPLTFGELPPVELGNVTEEEALDVLHRYDQEIRFVDEQFRQLMARIQELGLDENLLLFVTADHGEAFWEHGQMGHGKDLFNETLRIPLLVSIPGATPSRVIDAHASSVDLMPTLLDMAGVDVPEGLAGRSLRGLLVEGADPVPRPVVSELWSGSRIMKSIIDPPYKLILDQSGRQTGEGQRLLFNIEEDPWEQRSIEESQPEVASRLEADLMAIIEASREMHHTEGDQSVEMDPGTVERLKAMGYLN